MKRTSLLLLLFSLQTALADINLAALIQSQQGLSLQERLAHNSELFLGKPYAFEPVGEGADGQFDQRPLYRFDRFDCVSYLDTVIALSKASDVESFQQNIKNIRYWRGKIDYFARNSRFTQIRWNPNLHQLGYLRDITDTIKPIDREKITSTSIATIDIPNWARLRKLDEIKLQPPQSVENTAERLNALHNHANQLKPEISQIDYIPLTRLFPNGKADRHLFNQIPSGAVIEVIRPNYLPQTYAYQKGYGTRLNVAHNGITVRNQKGLLFRHASSLYHVVKEIPLEAYLYRYLNHDEVKGIHIEQLI